MMNHPKNTGQGGVGMGPGPQGTAPGKDPDSKSGAAGREGTDPGVGETGIPLPTGDHPDPRGGTIETDFEDLTEPTGDANFPDPSKPIMMADQSGRRPEIPGGGYGDSRGTEEPADSSSASGGTAIRSGSNLNDDDSKSTSDMPRSGADQPEHPEVSQPANVAESRRST